MITLQAMYRRFRSEIQTVILLLKSSPRHRFYAIAGVWMFGVIVNAVRLPYAFAPRIQIEKVTRAPLDLVVRASGNLEARASVTLKAPFEGKVLTKQFREGQEVKAGDKLMVLDRDKIRLDFLNRRDALANAQSDLARSKKDLRVQKSLYRRQAVAYSSVEDAERALVRAAQVLRNAEQAYKLEADRWNAYEIVAPFAGTIVKDNIPDAQQVVSGQDMLMLADVSDFSVRARVDELDVKQIREGQMAEVRVPIFPNAVFQAKVTQVGTAPDGPGLPEIPVILKLTHNKDYLLRPRLTADVRILTGRTTPVLSVPLKAITNTDGVARVWCLSWMRRLHLQPLTLGRSNPDRVEVLSGLSDGQRVCTESAPELREGMKVILGKRRERPETKTQALRAPFSPGDRMRPR